MRIKMFIAGLAALVSSGAASAQSIQVTNWGWSPGLVKSDARRYTPDSSSYLARDGLGVGQFKLSGTTVPGGAPIDIYSFCVDLYSGIDNGLYSYVSGAALIPDLQRRRMIETLLAHTMPILNSATGNNATVISAATQMAIWELEYETAGQGLNVGAGDLRLGNFQTSGEVYTDIGAAMALSNSYLANFTNNSWQLLDGLDVRYLAGQNGQQGQVFLVPSVPEPATWAMMIAGLGIVGTGLRRRAKAKARVKTTVSYS